MNYRLFLIWIQLVYNLGLLTKSGVVVVSFVANNRKTPVNYRYNTFYNRSLERGGIPIRRLGHDAKKEWILQSRVCVTQNCRYNNHPKFATGSYNLDGVHITESFLSSSEFSQSDKAHILYAITRLREVNVLSDGYLSVSALDADPYWKNGVKSQGHLGVTSDRNIFSDLSLSMITRNLSEQEKEDDHSFLRKLQSEPIKSLDVRNLLEENNERSKDLRGDLEKIFREFITKNVTMGNDEDLFVYLGWDYKPHLRKVNLYVLVKKVNVITTVEFKLVPGIKPLRIGKSEINLLRPANPCEPHNAADYSDILKQYTVKTQFAECIVKPCGFHLKDNIAIVYVDYSHMYNNKIHKPTQENLSYMIKVLKMSGAKKKRFNTLFRVLEVLDKVLPSENKDGYIDDHKYLDYKDESKLPDSISLQLLNIYVNGKFRTFVPLLAYLDIDSGKWFLCSNLVEIEDVFKHSKLWYPWNDKYSAYNIEAIPVQYRHSMFTSTDNIIFDDKDLAKIVANHRYFSKYDILNIKKGDKIKNIIHINKPGRNSFNIVV